jgi:hypothetical protein
MKKERCHQRSFLWLYSIACMEDTALRTILQKLSGRDCKPKSAMKRHGSLYV